MKPRTAFDAPQSVYIMDGANLVMLGEISATQEIHKLEKPLVADVAEKKLSPVTVAARDSRSQPRRKGV